MDRIFEEFEQADGSSTRAHGGAGLGLAISRRIVEVDGRTISVTSDFGRGSEFSFEIPASGSGCGRLARFSARGPPLVILSRNEVECDAIARTILAYGGAADVVPFD